MTGSRGVERKLALTVVTGVLVALLLLTVATSGEVRIWHAPPEASPTDATMPPSDTTVPTTTIPLAAPGADTSDSADLPRWLVVTLRILLYSSLALGFLALLRAAWRRRPELSWRNPITSTFDVEVLPTIPEAVADDADEQRAVLRRGAPRNAIVECWLRLEDIIVDSGVAHDPADTSLEFTTRVLASLSLDTGAVLTLSALYREARFSTHTMGEDLRELAVEALDTIHRGLAVSAGVAS